MRKVLSLLGLFFFLSLPAGAQEYQQDVNFFELQVAQPVHTGEKIEVLELFWYRCPHCYALEPYLNKWLKNKPEFVEFVRLPAICLLYTSPSPRDGLLSRMPSSA